MTLEVNASGGQCPGRSTHQEVNAPKEQKVNAPEVNAQASMQTCRPEGGLEGDLTSRGT